MLLLLIVFSSFNGLTFTRLLVHIFLGLIKNLFIDLSGCHFGLIWRLELTSMHLLSLNRCLLLMNIFYLMLSFFYRFFGGDQVCLRG